MAVGFPFAVWIRRTAPGWLVKEGVWDRKYPGGDWGGMLFDHGGNTGKNGLGHLL